MPLLEWRGVTKRFGETLALDGVDLALEAREVLALLGPSGCGKTTLLRLTAGLDDPTEGSILADGVDLAGTPPHRRGFGLVFQDYCLFPHLDVEGNVGYGLRMARWPRQQARRRVSEMLRLVRLEGFERRSPLSLSGGEQQRVALARGLAPSPRLLMLDEPLGALDANLRAGLASEVPRILAAAGATALYVTHEQQEALAVAHRVAVMRSGRIVQVGRPRQLVEQPVDSFVARFLELGALVPVRFGDGALLETPFATLRLPNRPKQRAPGAHLLLVRPAAVLLASARVPGSVAVRVRVEAVRHTAEGARLGLSLDGRVAGELWCPWNGRGPAPAVGVRLRAAIDPQRVTVVPDAGT